MELHQPVVFYMIDQFMNRFFRRSYPFYLLVLTGEYYIENLFL